MHCQRSQDGSPDSSALTAVLPTAALAVAELDIVVDDRDSLGPESFITMAGSRAWRRSRQREWCFFLVGIWVCRGAGGRDTGRMAGRSLSVGWLAALGAAWRQGRGGAQNKSATRAK